jgi:hypothetical protein
VTPVPARVPARRRPDARRTHYSNWAHPQSVRLRTERRYSSHIEAERRQTLVDLHFTQQDLGNVPHGCGPTPCGIRRAAPSSELVLEQGGLQPVAARSALCTTARLDMCDAEQTLIAGSA